jgi:Type I phosphodiesterase / nucleotide pyrophosphatase
VIFVQLDGLAHEVLVRAIRNGDTPTLARWLRNETHRAMRWETDWSSQTGGSQSGLLQGSNFDMPAFRWWEKETNRALVSNHPRDAAEIERRHSDGHGLLAQGGASRGNVFSGDAPRSSLTMSTVLTRHREGRIGQAYYAYFANPYNLSRTILLAIREIARERSDAARQRHRDVSPRIARDVSYALLRAWTCVIQRDLQVQAVIGDMYEGRPVVFTDILGYDEVAHHSGVERADSLRVLRDIDRQLARLESAARDAPRPYQIVVLSDHGQSQGPTFRQRFGASLDELVRQASAARDIDSSSEGDESRGYLAGSLAEASAGKGFFAKLVRRLAPAAPDGTGAAPELVVMASGNLGLIYFGQRPGRVTLEEIQEAYPRLIPTLRSHPGIGFLMVRSERDGTIVVGKEGTHYLNDDRVAGADPLGLYGPNAAAHLRRSDGFPHVADIMVNSVCAGDTGEVFAFEELVGSHGGLGGAQSFPFLLVPSSWPRPCEPLLGAEAVHRYLRACLAEIGAADNNDSTPQGG